MTEEQALIEIGAIINAIDIDDASRIFFKKKEYIRPSANQDIFFSSLCQLVYTEFYCRRLNGKDKLTPLSGISTNSPTFESEKNDFIDTLKKANQTVDEWDFGWVIDSIDKAGQIMAKKNDEYRIVIPGEFILGYYSGQPLGPGTKINLHIVKEFIPLNNSFYFALSAAPTVKDTQSVVRFYFNLDSNGAAVLIKLITSHFNRYRVPFQVKCLNHPKLYTRTDSAVLYTQKKYAQLAYDLISGCYSEIKKYLRKDVPLFTKELIAGIAFAESPPDGDSFGMNRSKVIATGIVNAYNSKKKKEKRMEEIVASINSVGLTMKQLYLNPESHYNYPFLTSSGLYGITT